MPVTLGDLLAVPEFGLSLVVPHGAPADPVHATEVSWVHSSDLPDPAPWLEPGQLLLSDGAQFAGDPTESFAEAYASRLADRGLVGLALSEGIVHDSVPDAVIRACDAVGLPLLRVPRRTPFIAVIRHVADILAQDRRERLEWSLDAQRAVARAATGSGGLGATIAELERRLDGWVALYDTAGRPLPFGAVPEPLAAQVEGLVQRTLTTPSPHRRHRLGEGDAVALERIGSAAHPLGMLAVHTTAPFDAAENDLVASVLALASIALEQRRALDLERRRLRTGALELLLSGRADAASLVTSPLWGAVPEGSLRVALAPGAAEAGALLEALEGASAARGWVFFGERGDDVVVVADERGMRAARGILAAHDTRVGVSSTVDAASLERGLTEAAAALALSARRSAIGEYDDLAEEGLSGLLAASGGAGLARRMLAPLLDSDARRAPDAASLEQALRAWFESGCAWDRAARVLDVHRHTVRTRIARAAALLGRDLDDPTDRAETWLALRLLPHD